jgi:hypothetical protein
LRVQGNDHYLSVDERDDAEGAKDVDPQSRLTLNAFAHIDPPKDASRVTRDIVLDPGVTIRCKLVGPTARRSAAYNPRRPRTMG